VRVAIVAAACAFTFACGGDIARITGRPEGTITLRPGMTRADATRQSTIKLNTFGDSGRFFDFVLAGDGIRFAGNTQYLISEDSRGRIESL
jgi:hypothetical protein